MERTIKSVATKQRTLEGGLEAHKSVAKSFKNTTSVALAVTKTRIHIQNDLQKISAGKDQLEALKNMKKTRAPIITVEEKASIVNKA